MKVAILSECPWAPSSFGKITMVLAAGLIQHGYEVSVVCPALSLTSNGGPLTFNPSRTATRINYPDVDIDVYPFISPAYAANKILKHVDVVLSYSTHYAPPGTEFNQAVSLSKKPSLAYTVSEALAIPRGAAESILAYSAVAAPTKFTLSTFTTHLPIEERYMVVAPHNLPPDMYPDCVEEPTIDVAFIAKNHPRKDAYAAIMVSAILMQKKIIDSIGVYLIDAVSAPTWNIADIVSIASHTYRVDMKNKVEILTQEASMRGLTDEELTKLLCKTRLLLYPTYGESFGLTPLEAVIHKRVFVATRHPALEEIWGQKPLAQCHTTHCHGVPLCEVDIEELAETAATALSQYDEYMAYEMSRARRIPDMIKPIVYGLELAYSDPTPLSEKLKSRENSQQHTRAEQQ